MLSRTALLVAAPAHAGLAASPFVLHRAVVPAASLGASTGPAASRGQRRAIASASASRGPPAFPALPLPAAAAAARAARAAGIRAFRTTVPLGEVHYKVEKDAVKQALSPVTCDVDYVKHPVYTQDEVHAVQVTHRPVHGMSDRIALSAISTMRFVFDKFTGYSHDPSKPMTEEKWLQRMIFLETVAGVPGMVGGMTRHLHSLRKMRRDYGWIHMLLGEAENERMHLLTFLTLKSPSILFRGMVLMAQGVFFNLFFLSYLVAPRTCHRFVGYLEEEAVITYTRCIQDLEAGKLQRWASTPAPEIAKAYWRLPENAMMLDVLYAVRADEQHHRDTNHSLASVKTSDPNPLIYGGHHESQPPPQQQQH